MLRSRVLVLAAGAAGHGAGVQHHRRPSALVEAGEGVLQPGPVALAGGDAAGGAEAVKRVILEDVRIEVLVPHGIGDHDVVTGYPTRGVLELRVEHRVAALDLDLHVVDDGVHVGDGVTVGLQLLAMEPERDAAGGVGLAGDELKLDEQPRRAAGVVVARLAGPWAHQVRHEETDLGRREELARALAGAFGEFAQQIFISAAQEVGLHVGQAEAVAGVGEGLDDGGEPGRVDVALAIALGREVHQVDDAGERRVPPDDRTHRSRQVLANVAGSGAPPPVVEGPVVRLSPADDAPSGLRRQVETQQVVVALRDLPRGLLVPEVLGQPVDLVVENVRESLGMV